MVVTLTAQAMLLIVLGAFALISLLRKGVNNFWALFWGFLFGLVFASTTWGFGIATWLNELAVNLSS